ncbi:hypothetical protein F2Q69_00047656 [Brassica cretica]|uniref:Uncharacterized protein n=1 Tax=Brassica cretica TaxID=69181 RepID=A0A8S9PSU2_BRACR|nr:hypothetical protein F2Q69_00047656 [Brassica cretica]
MFSQVSPKWLQAGIDGDGRLAPIPELRWRRTLANKSQAFSVFANMCKNGDGSEASGVPAVSDLKVDPTSSAIGD